MHNNGKRKLRSRERQLQDRMRRRRLHKRREVRRRNGGEWIYTWRSTLVQLIEKISGQFSLMAALPRRTWGRGAKISNVDYRSVQKRRNATTNNRSGENKQYRPKYAYERSRRVEHDSCSTNGDNRQLSRNR